MSQELNRIICDFFDRMYYFDQTYIDSMVSGSNKEMLWDNKDFLDGVKKYKHLFNEFSSSFLIDKIIARNIIPALFRKEFWALQHNPIVEFFSCILLLEPFCKTNQFSEEELELIFDFYCFLLSSASEETQCTEGVSSRMPCIITLAHLLSQCSVESGNFRRFKENMRYSKERLKEVFKAPLVGVSEEYLTEITAEPDEERIANLVYKKHGGYKYIGRGAIQITGEYNYNNIYTKCLSKNLVATAGAHNDNLTYYASLYSTDLRYWSAIAFFDVKNIWNLSVKSDVAAVTKKINPALMHLKERAEKFRYYKELLIELFI